MDSINFEYPNRPEVKVFENLTFEIKQGQKIAFVGGSGCGKSTVIQLIERFYDPCSGEVKMGRNNLKALDLGFVRSKLSIVSQEPVLFDITIGILNKLNIIILL
jgi:ABC-type multidrug transport system fused ATPase/permease subunit